MNPSSDVVSAVTTLPICMLLPASRLRSWPSPRPLRLDRRRRARRGHDLGDRAAAGWVRRSALAPRGQPGDELVQAVKRVVDALLHPGLDHRVAVRDGLEDRMGAQQGAAVALLEPEPLQRDLSIISCDRASLTSILIN